MESDRCLLDVIGDPDALDDFLVPSSHNILPEYQMEHVHPSDFPNDIDIAGRDEAQFPHNDERASGLILEEWSQINDDLFGNDNFNNDSFHISMGNNVAGNVTQMAQAPAAGVGHVQVGVRPFTDSSAARSGVGPAYNTTAPVQMHYVVQQRASINVTNTASLTLRPPVQQNIGAVGVHNMGVAVAQQLILPAPSGFTPSSTGVIGRPPAGSSPLVHQGQLEAGGHQTILNNQTGTVIQTVNGQRIVIQAGQPQQLAFQVQPSVVNNVQIQPAILNNVQQVQRGIVNSLQVQQGVVTNLQTVQPNVFTNLQVQPGVANNFQVQPDAVNNLGLQGRSGVANCVPQIAIQQSRVVGGTSGNIGVTGGALGNTGVTVGSAPHGTAVVNADGSTTGSVMVQIGGQMYRLQHQTRPHGTVATHPQPAAQVGVTNHLQFRQGTATSIGNQYPTAMALDQTHSSTQQLGVAIKPASDVNRTIQVTPNQLHILQQSAELQQMLLGRQMNVLQLLQQQQQSGVEQTTVESKSSVSVIDAPTLPGCGQFDNNVATANWMSVPTLSGAVPVAAPTVIGAKVLPIVPVKAVVPGSSATHQIASVSTIPPTAGTAIVRHQAMASLQGGQVPTPAPSGPAQPRLAFTPQQQALLAKVQSQIAQLLAISHRSESQEKGLALLAKARQKLIAQGQLQLKTNQGAANQQAAVLTNQPTINSQPSILTAGPSVDNSKTAATITSASVSSQLPSSSHVGSGMTSQSVTTSQSSSTFQELKAENIFKLYPQLRAKLDAQLARMPPEKRAWFAKNQDAVFKKLQQQHHLLMQQQQLKQQQQQLANGQKSVQISSGVTSDPAAISSSSSSISSNFMSSSLPPQALSTADTSKATVRSTSDIMEALARQPAKKAHVFQLYLGKDQKRATHPDCRTPFTGFKDVLRTLVPYHVFQEGDEQQEELAEGEAALERRSRELIDLKDAMLDKYRLLLLSDAQLTHSTAESVMIDRIFLNTERQILVDERRQAREHPESFIPMPILEGAIKKSEIKTEIKIESDADDDDDDDDDDDKKINCDIKEENEDDEGCWPFRQAQQPCFVKIEPTEGGDPSNAKCAKSSSDSAETSPGNNSYTIRSSGRLSFVFKSSPVRLSSPDRSVAMDRGSTDSKRPASYLVTSGADDQNLLVKVKREAPVDDDEDDDDDDVPLLKRSRHDFAADLSNSCRSKHSIAETISTAQQGWENQEDDINGYSEQQATLSEDDAAVAMLLGTEDYGRDAEIRAANYDSFVSHQEINNLQSAMVQPTESDVANGYLLFDEEAGNDLDFQTCKQIYKEKISDSSNFQIDDDSFKNFFPVMDANGQKEAVDIDGSCVETEELEQRTMKYNNCAEPLHDRQGCESGLETSELAMAEDPLDTFEDNQYNPTQSSFDMAESNCEQLMEMFDSNQLVRESSHDQSETVTSISHSLGSQSSRRESTNDDEMQCAIDSILF